MNRSKFYCFFFKKKNTMKFIDIIIERRIKNFNILLESQFKKLKYVLKPSNTSIAITIYAINKSCKILLKEIFIELL